jgi:hypothetical protein
LPQDEHRISEDEANAFAKEFGMQFFLSSARQMINIDAPFTMLARRVYEANGGVKKPKSPTRKSPHCLLL